MLNSAKVILMIVRMRSRNFLILLTALALPASRHLVHIWLCSAFQRAFTSVYVSLASILFLRV